MIHEFKQRTKEGLRCTCDKLFSEEDLYEHISDHIEED